MRIWCQSTGALGKSPVWDSYAQSLKRHIRAVVRPDTAVELHGTDFTFTSAPGQGVYRAARLINQLQVIRNAMRAEEEGYDAFLLLTTSDIGTNEIRELVQIPVIFSTETCLHLACLLSDKFALITNNAVQLTRMTELAHDYGMEARMVPGGHLALRQSDLMDSFQHPKRHIDLAEKVVKEIGARGANLLYPAPGELNQWLIDNNLREIDGITIMDSLGAALKMAESMVDLQAIGIKRSPRYYPRPHPGVLAALKQVYNDLLDTLPGAKPNKTGKIKGPAKLQDLK